MKRIYTLVAFALLLVSACKKDNEKPEDKNALPAPNPTSSLILSVDNKSYNLKVTGHIFETKDTARIKLNAALPEVRLRLEAKAVVHTGGVGDYTLVCCDNDIFEKFSAGAEKHWEGDGGGIPGSQQVGFVKITKKDSKGYEGTFSLRAKDGATSSALIKEFTGSFVVVN